MTEAPGQTRGSDTARDPDRTTRPAEPAASSTESLKPPAAPNGAAVTPSSYGAQSFAPGSAPTVGPAAQAPPRAPGPPAAAAGESSSAPTPGAPTTGAAGGAGATGNDWREQWRAARSADGSASLSASASLGSIRADRTGAPSERLDAGAGAVNGPPPSSSGPSSSASSKPVPAVPSSTKGLSGAAVSTAAVSDASGSDGTGRKSGGFRGALATGLAQAKAVAAGSWTVPPKDDSAARGLIPGMDVDESVPATMGQPSAVVPVTPDPRAGTTGSAAAGGPERGAPAGTALASAGGPVASVALHPAGPGQEPSVSTGHGPVSATGHGPVSATPAGLSAAAPVGAAPSIAASAAAGTAPAAMAGATGAASTTGSRAAVPPVRRQPPAGPVSPPPSAVSTTSAAPPRPRTNPGRLRRAHLKLTRIDPWTIMKVSFMLAIAFGIMTIVAVAVVWSMLDAAGVFTSLNDTVESVTGEGGGALGFDLMSWVAFDRVLGFATLIAVVDVVLITALSTLAAFLYNLAASLLGGVEVTFVEDHS